MFARRVTRQALRHPAEQRNFAPFRAGQVAMNGKMLMALLILATSGLYRMPAPSKSEAPVDLTVSVFNDAGVSPVVLMAAKNRATAILARAGFTLNWVDCGAHEPDKLTDRATDSQCSAINYPEHLSIRLAGTLNNVTHTSRETFGQAYLDASGRGSYATIYVERLTNSSATEIVRTGDLLGCVAAHELGHLLLGRNSHAPFGLMAALWQPAELQSAAKGNFYFTESEGERMRARFVSLSAESNTSGPGPRMGK
jgi:hypothetical protein